MSYLIPICSANIVVVLCSVSTLLLFVLLVLLLYFVQYRPYSYMFYQYYCSNVFSSDLFPICSTSTIVVLCSVSTLFLYVLPVLFVYCVPYRPYSYMFYQYYCCTVLSIDPVPICSTSIIVVLCSVSTLFLYLLPVNRYNKQMLYLLDLISYDRNYPSLYDVLTI